MTIEQYLEINHIPSMVYDNIRDLTRMVHYKEGDMIIRMGETYTTINLILSGIVRGFYIDENGNEITKCFSCEGQWCGYYNFLERKPSPFYIEAVEDCCLARFNVIELQNAIQNNEILKSLYDQLTKQAFLQAEEKGISFQIMDAKERYLNYKEKYPEICQRVKQEYIASYLGITPSSLSRIKKSLG